LDSGLSIIEVNSLFRQAAIRTVATRQLEDARRVNISGIAAITGISRAEISGLLKPVRRTVNRNVKPRQNLTNNILTAWHCDPKFTTANRRPADLKIYGRGATFEALVREHGRGIPIRAILDEMLRSGAVEMRGSQEIRPMKSITIGTRITPRSIRTFAERAAKLFSVALEDLRHPDSSIFIESAARTRTSPSSIPLFRKELSGKAAELLGELQNILTRMPTRTRTSGNTPSLGRLSVTIIYHGDLKKSLKVSSKKRRNFRRNP
jgi:Family of unknown function (DUF6502)